MGFVVVGVILFVVFLFLRDKQDEVSKIQSQYAIIIVKESRPTDSNFTILQPCGCSRG